MTQSKMKEVVEAWVDMCEAVLIGQKFEPQTVETF